MFPLARFNTVIGGSLLQKTLNLGETVWKGFTTMAENKTPRLMQRIGTHSGMFHCDEALACFMLKQLPKYESAEVVRTRDMEVLATCDIVVDVGAVYDPKINRFDHHQREFEHTLSTVRPELAKNKTIKLSSAGLIYAHFGMEVIENLLTRRDIMLTTEALENIYIHVYEGFVEEMDAIDNGIPMYGEGIPRYRINTDLSSRVHRLNPDWDISDEETIQKCFYKAVDLVGVEFTEILLEATTIWWPARDIVKKAIKNRHNVYSTGEILLLEDRCPWKDHLHSLEEEMGIKDEIKFCIFHDAKSSWRVQGIPKDPGSFICRVFLHKEWRGVRDEVLSKVSGVDGSIFCHATGFIGGNQTKEGALQMAIKSLQASQINKE
ncbi:unnamed protein product [Brassicogethes aeneus]|uniref:Uncharacterized protein n=1 Tax=Brassicogethes aeneus TaxID=1431903 RepID=A0A9P0AXC1_BRAAE|nr:unnamed protein product [Brassicogethes aeneus]